MTDYKKLVEALRVEPFEVGSVGVARVMQDAAAAIEALQSEQKKTVTQIFCEEQAAWEGRCKDLMKQISELQAEVEEQKQIAAHYEQTAKDYWKEACEYKAQLPNTSTEFEVDSVDLEFREPAVVNGVTNRVKIVIDG